MDYAQCNTSDIAYGNDSRSVHRNITDCYIDSGADIDIYPKNFGSICVHSIIVAVDGTKNAGDDARNFRSA